MRTNSYAAHLIGATYAPHLLSYLIIKYIVHVHKKYRYIDEKDSVRLWMFTNQYRLRFEIRS